MLLTKKEVSERLRVTVKTVERMMLRGMPYLKNGNTVRFEWDKIVYWMGDRK